MANVLGPMEKRVFFAKVFAAEQQMRKFPPGFMMYLDNLMKTEKVIVKNGKTYMLSQVPHYPSKAFTRYLGGLLACRNGHHTPMSLEFAITNACPCRCWHCSNEGRAGKDLSTEKCIEIMRGFIDLGVTWIGLSGGEPLMRKDLEEIIECSNGDADIAIFTTGSTLTKERAKSLKRAGLNSFVISIDSMDAATHDKLRGKKGTFKAAMKTIEISNELGLYTVISTVGTRQSVRKKQMEKFLKWAKKKGVDEVRILPIAISGKLLEGFDEPLEKQDIDELKRLHVEGNQSKDFPRVMSFNYLESPETLGCTGGYQHLTIDAQGNVCPCPFLALSLGNVAEEGVNPVWKRYKKYYKVPRRTCINTQVWKQIQKVSNKGQDLPVQTKDTIKILRTLKKEELPGFYEQLIKK